MCNVLSGGGGGGGGGGGEVLIVTCIPSPVSIDCHSKFPEPEPYSVNKKIPTMDK